MATALEDAARALRESLALSSTRVVDLFKEWDDDDSGTISLKEWRQAIAGLGLVDDAPANEDRVTQLFRELDENGSGSIEYAELHKVLRIGIETSLDAKLMPGAAGEISLKSENKHALRRGDVAGKAGRVLPMAVKLKPIEDGKGVVEQLRDILNENAVRVIDLFRSWDEDGNGTITVKEMRKAITALGYSASKDDFMDLFRQLDSDGSGSIEYKELHKVLRIGLGRLTLPKLTRGAAAAAKGARPPWVPTLDELKANAGTEAYYRGRARLQRHSPRPQPLPELPRVAEAKKREENRQWLLERRKKLEAISKRALVREKRMHELCDQRARDAFAKRRQAATVVQAHGRGAIARNRREMRRREHAAVALQARCRGIHERGQLTVRRDEALDRLRAQARALLVQNDAFLSRYFEAAEERLRQADYAEMVAAATKHLLPWWDGDDVDDSQGEKEDAAAAVLQRCFLGARDRASFHSARGAARVVP